jgi:hypothetical protein
LFVREEDVAAEIQALSLQSKGNNDSEEEEEEAQPVKKKKVFTGVRRQREKSHRVRK